MGWRVAGIPNGPQRVRGGNALWPAVSPNEILVSLGVGRMEPGSPRAVAGAAAVGRFREESRLLLSEMDLDGACFPARLARRRGPATVALPLLAWRLLDWCTGHCRPCCGLVVLRRLRRVGGPLLLHQRGGGVPPWSSVVARRARSAGCALRLRPCTPLERAIASRAAAQTSMDPVKSETQNKCIAVPTLNWEPRTRSVKTDLVNFTVVCDSLD